MVWAITYHTSKSNQPLLNNAEARLKACHVLRSTNFNIVEGLRNHLGVKMFIISEAVIADDEASLDSGG